MESLVFEIVQMQQRIDTLEAQINRVTSQQPSSLAEPDDETQAVAVESVPRPAAASDLEYLAAAGVDTEVASELLRQISWQQFRTMELRNLMRNAEPSDRRYYSEELRDLNQSRVSLRAELGDDVYDKYLYVSGKSNRVKVSVVMAGSPAESNGVQPGDIILRYNDTKIVEARDLQQAALGGDSGSYANLEILRDGSLMNLMLPQGTMGVQMQPMRMDPGQ